MTNPKKCVICNRLPKSFLDYRNWCEACERAYHVHNGREPGNSAEWAAKRARNCLLADLKAEGRLDQPPYRAPYFGESSMTDG